jgi:prephenate dehydratase
VDRYHQSQLTRIDRAITALRAERRRVAARVPVVAFQGAPGAFSEEAVAAFFDGRATLRPCRTLADAFAAVATGVADAAVVPTENSLAGAVPGSSDLIRRHDVHAAGQRRLPIAHMLIGTPDAALDQVRIVRSHPVALAQCRRFFASHPEISAEPAFDTAGAVADVIAAGDPRVAAAGSARAAAIYGGRILAEHIQDTAENVTTFVLILPGKQVSR